MIDGCLARAPRFLADEARDQVTGEPGSQFGMQTACRFGIHIEMGSAADRVEQMKIIRQRTEREQFARQALECPG